MKSSRFSPIASAVVVFVASLLGACGPAAEDAGEEPAPDGGSLVDGGGGGDDAGVIVDAGEGDAGAADAGLDDAGSEDAGDDAGVVDAGHDAGPLDGGDGDGGVDDGGVVSPYPIDGFGIISGPCDVLDDELTSAAPFVHVTHIDFGTDPYDDPQDFDLLTSAGQEILLDGNAGGSSLESEVFAAEMLVRCEGATLLKTETEIVYDIAGKITDLLVEKDGIKLGVSVTRAVAFPFENPYTVEQAEALLVDKLADILESSANVSAEDAWQKQILHVLAYADGHAASIETALAGIDPLIVADTIVSVTVTDGDDAFIY